MSNTAPFTSSLPFGQPYPVGDRELWDSIIASGILGDAVQMYADVRGLTRQQAKDETFTIRYGMLGGKPKPLESLLTGNGDPVKVKFLPFEPTGFIWQGRTESMPKPLRDLTDESCVKPRRATYISVNMVVGCTVPDVPYSRHRSKRLWKKLRQRKSERVLSDAMQMCLSEKLARFLVEKQRNNGTT